MQIQCVHCGKQYSLRDESVGSQFACRSCGKLSPVSAAKPEESALVGPPLPAPVRQAAPASPAGRLIETRCRHCGKQYKVSGAAGAQFRCKQCGKLSAIDAAAPQPTERVLKALPQSARPAPPPAKPARAAPLTARPAARPAQARLVAMPEEPVAAELVAEPIEASPLVSPGMLDLLDEATLPGASSHYGLAATETRTLPPAPSPPRKRKPKRKSGSGFDGEKLGLVLGGIFFICVGIGLFALGVLAVQNDVRRPGGYFRWGIVAIISGFMMVIGRPITRD